MQRERHDLLAQELTERADGSGDTAELTLFAALAAAVAGTVFTTTHEHLAAGTPAEQVTAAVDAVLDRSLALFARAYKNNNVLDRVQRSSAKSLLYD
ncbi:hypothetical protein ACFVZR_28785 [Streptomyces sp. NPDC058316]|uniref:hypothetical protein n=1 Tax=unclassified Streptomyces TaxID=2593676 RepID=UPI0036E28C39